MAKVDDLLPPPSPHGLENFVRESPLRAVMGALIAGILLSRLGISLRKPRP